MQVTIQWGLGKKGFIRQPIPKGMDEVVIILSEPSEVLNWYATGKKKALKKGVLRKEAVFSGDMELKG